MSGTLTSALNVVLERDNCSGCGACGALSPGIRLEIDSSGYLRPRIDDPAVGSSKELGRAFKRVCPGVQVRAEPPDMGASVHPIFGRYLGVWQGHAGEPSERWEGSSGGLLTTLSRFILGERMVSSVVCAVPDATHPTQTQATTLRNKEEVCRAAGSRYAPVGVAGMYGAGQSRQAFVGKPCEVSAVRALSRDDGTDVPIILTFFCAGTPSQLATDRILYSLGAATEDVTSLRYRGNGWPGKFAATLKDGKQVVASYEDSWGKYLGRELQWRCKICPDGTGNDADIAVGDMWESDQQGFPLFNTGKGNSVIIARTRRGYDLVERAAISGVIKIRPLDLSGAASVQPLQVARKSTLAGRLLGRLLIGRPGPRFRGHGILLLGLRNPAGNLRALAGTVRRAMLRRQSREDW